MSCPSCDSWTNDIGRAAHDGEPCPICGKPLPFREPWTGHCEKGDLLVRVQALTEDNEQLRGTAVSVIHERNFLQDELAEVRGDAEAVQAALLLVNTSLARDRDSAEYRIAALERENEQLRSEVERLETDYERLYMEVAALRGVVSRVEAAAVVPEQPTQETK